LDVVEFTDVQGATDLDQLLNRAVPSFDRADRFPVATDPRPE
jgi:hypothetical protein